MDFIDRMTGNRWAGVQPATFLKFTNLDVRVQKHLQRTYATLLAALALSAVGCAADLAYHVSGIITYLAALGCLVGLSMTPSTPHTLNKRYAMLAGFSFCQGASLGGLVGLAAAISPSLVLTAFMCTAAIFLSFSLAALLSPRRSFLYLGGWLASAVSGLMVLRMSTWLFGGAVVAFQAELYVGLLVFAGYTIFDTQLIVEKAAAGSVDHVRSALDLLVDVLALFVRVLVILVRNAERKQQEEARRKSSKRRD